ncbi:hypothetical protein [Campylobacter helveticus]|uniref:hypothetical protein n=1 Tax=Campylobacter helveticus TaxID=28898 RepID=UPI00242A46B9|nr:hypothetical protein [Campylobacter helveticus]
MKEFFAEFKPLFNTKLKKILWTVFILVLGYYILFYTEFENGYVKIMPRPFIALHQNWYCIKENRQLDRDEVFERATKDLLKKLYDNAHRERWYHVDQEEWYYNDKCFFRDKEKERESPNCQFFSNGKQFDIDDIIKQIDFNKTQAENLQKITQDFSVVRPFEEKEKILMGDAYEPRDLKLKYSLLYDDKGTIIFIDITFMEVGGYDSFVIPSKFGYYDYGLALKMYLIGKKESDKKFDEKDLEYWKDNDFRRHYDYYPITNCGEVKIRSNDNYEWISERSTDSRFNRKIRWIF